MMILSVVLGEAVSADDDWVHSIEPYDYKNGFLDDDYIIKSNTLDNRMYDNNISVEFNLRTPEMGVIEFNKPVHIKSAYLNIRNAYSSVYFYFDDNTVSELTTGNGTTNKYFSLNHKDVVKITLSKSSGGSPYFREIDFFGTYNKSEVVPDPEPEEILNLTANVEFNRVDLSWENPGSDKFAQVNIYRDRVGGEKRSGVTKKEATKIFETNGTYFNDLTVSAETSYDYLLTTQSVEGRESDGVIRRVKTPSVPLPEMGGQETEVDPDGNYTFKWTSPTSGKVKIIVGGKEYKVVNASDLKITIPAKDMKFTVFGAPDVKLIAIDENGNEGIPTNPTAPEGGGGVVELPFGSLELLKITFSFIGIISGLILLAMAIYLVPKIIAVIKKSVKKEETGTGRRK